MNTVVLSKGLSETLQKDLWQKENAEYYHNLNQFKPEQSDYCELAEGDCHNKIIRKDYLETKDLFFSEEIDNCGLSFTVAALKNADSVKFTKEQVCIIPLRNIRKQDVSEVIKDLKPLSNDLSEQDCINLCADRIMSSINNEEDVKLAYRYLVESLRVDEKPSGYFYNKGTEDKVRLLSSDREQFLQILLRNTETSLEFERTVLDDTTKELINTKKLLKNAYNEKSDLNKKLQNLYSEKSGVNARLQQAYKEKSELNKQFKEIREELENVKTSKNYETSEKLAYWPRKLLRKGK